MPARCCVPGCTVTRIGGAGIHLFAFPRDEEMKKKWKKAIPRKDWEPNRSTTVCSAHFREEDIKKVDILKRPDGSEIEVPRDRWGLRANSVPTIFPGLPKYLSKRAPAQRTDPADRRKRIKIREEEAFQAVLELDKIGTLQNVVINTDKYNSKDWLLKSLQDKVYFLNVCTDHVMAKIKCSIMLDVNFNVKLFVADKEISVNRVKSILGSNLKCDSYSKLENLINYMDKTFSEKNMRTNEERIECIIEEINFLIKDEAIPDSIMQKLKFLSHQLRLVFANKVLYPAEIITFSYLFLYTFPAGYKYIRDCGYLTLPHPNYLKTFATGNLETGLAEKYLSEKIPNLEPHEKFVSLLLDKIYVKKNIPSEGNKVEGLVSNALENSSSAVPATTVQAFMITSLLSNNKDIVGIYPVKTLDSSLLHELCMKVLNALHAAGYEVVSVIADNNQVNRKLFKFLSPHNELQPYIPSPYNSEKKMFLLFDTVHILKSIRNEWFKKDQVLTFPSFENNSIIEHARVKDLKIMHESEKNSSLKLAPSLTYKALYPSSLEKQNGALVLKIFDEKSVVALDSFKDELGIESEGTKHFIDLVLKWWTAVNVKHPRKDVSLYQELALPVEELDQENLVFLKTFLDWLQAWEELETSPSNETPGKLTNETFSAIFHTTASLLCLCQYLLKELQFKYVFLGKFQTDPLKQRLDLYRTMSGRNYRLQDILESENSLE